MWRNVNSREPHQIKNVRQNWKRVQDPWESRGDEATTELKDTWLSFLRNGKAPTGRSDLVEQKSRRIQGSQRDFEGSFK